MLQVFNACQQYSGVADQRATGLEQQSLLAVAETRDQCLTEDGDGGRNLITIAYAESSSDVDMRDVDVLCRQTIDE